MPEAEAIETPGAQARMLLEAIGDPRRDAIAASDVAVVIAHPDDETIGCGAQLGRLRGRIVILVTDGAPRNGTDARRSGFATPEAYAAARHNELLVALRHAGVSADALTRLNVPDQQAALHLVDIARQLVDCFSRCRIHVILTHAYEGGHPDHDATAFAVHAAAALLARAGHPISIIEMPLYRAGPEGPARQSFPTDSGTSEIAVVVDERWRVLKEKMVAAHASQQAVLRDFSLEIEKFRLTSAHDFTKLPNEGRLLYETMPWGMTGERWLELTAAALRELGIGRRA